MAPQQLSLTALPDGVLEQTLLLLPLRDRWDAAQWRMPIPASIPATQAPPARHCRSPPSPLLCRASCMLLCRQLAAVGRGSKLQWRVTHDKDPGLLLQALDAQPALYIEDLRWGGRHTGSDTIHTYPFRTSCQLCDAQAVCTRLGSRLTRLELGLLDHDFVAGPWICGLSSLRQLVLWLRCNHRTTSPEHRTATLSQHVGQLQRLEVRLYCWGTALGQQQSPEAGEPRGHTSRLAPAQGHMECPHPIPSPRLPTPHPSNLQALNVFGGNLHLKPGCIPPSLSEFRVICSSRTPASLLADCAAAAGSLRLLAVFPACKN